jgi:hypothetical protein
MPNSFYRFQPAWNAGFYPDNQITANLLNEVAGNIGAWLPGFFTGKTISQLVQGVRGQMDIFNVSPYFGNLEIINTTAPDPPFVDYYIYVRNSSLYAIDNSQQILVSGQYNPTTNVVANATISAFTPGSYSGSFDYSPIPVEAEVDRALQIVEQNGSAFFPLTYSFDSGSSIATSGLARGKNWQLDSSGNSTRLPADTLPKQNARTFSVAPQTAEDRYSISLMEKVINFSFTNTVAIEVRDYFNSFTIPDGWTRGAAIVAGTYERIYLNLYRDDRSLLMIGRLDTTWLWQRFLDDSGTNDVNYFIDYSSTTPLPYLPLSSYQWLYNDWYDMEFVEFNSGCYESPEFYAMPAIPGDNWQFNVPSDSGNLTGLTTASVGLFSQDGQFIQQIGEAVNPPCCFEMLLAYQTVAGANPNFIAYSDLIDSINTLEVPLKFNFSNQTLNHLGTSASSQITSELTDFILEIPAPLPYDRQDFIDLLAAETWGYGIIVTGELVNNGSFEGVKIKFCNYENAPYPSIVAYYVSPGSGENIYQSYINSLCCPKSQFQATTLIPAVTAGCYRLGLYAESEGGFYLYSLSNIINIDGSDCFSTMLEFWANDNSIAQGFEYFNNWKQRVRLGINGGGAKPVIEENLYRQSNGVHRRPQNKQDLSLDLHTDFIDPETQLALVDATRHPYLIWDNKSIFVKGDIDVATIQDFTTQSSFETLAQVKFSALLQGFQPKNSSCLTC